MEAKKRLNISATIFLVYSALCNAPFPYPSILKYPQSNPTKIRVPVLV